jgi:hypothetical protein
MRAGGGHAGRLSRRDALATLTALDRRLLALLGEQRELTQTQLERLLADVPARTLRYRTERLTRLGLLGRSRPYRDKGSAPFHYWPTRLRMRSSAASRSPVVVSGPSRTRSSSCRAALGAACAPHGAGADGRSAPAGVQT